MATALTAWLVAPAPIACTSARPFSRTTPAIAPATALGRDRAETFRTSPLRCSTSAAPSVAATAPLTDPPLA
jgi:hypothetical protein